MKPIFIAEIKTKSMFGFESKYSRYALTELALKYGDWISVHTDPRFGGSFDDIYLLRKETKKPILAKGFHAHVDDVKKAFDLGADYVLTVARDDYRFNCIHNKRPNILFETNSIDDISNFGADKMKYVYNGRSLKTGIGKKYIGDYQQFRNKANWLCGASLIQRPEDVQRFYPNCDAFIVGQNLVEFCTHYKHDMSL